MPLHSPHSASAEDLRQFQLHLTDTGTSRITINTTITALRFFFEVTVGDKEIVGKLKTVPVPRKLPVVLSREEVSRLLAATHSLKYKAAFSVAYGAGLRVSEVTTLKISDIDGERKTLHVEQGEIVNEPALIEVLKSGRISAGLDVFHQEPLADYHPFRQLENVIITPHTAYNTPEANMAIFESVVANLEAYCAGDPINVANR